MAFGVAGLSVVADSLSAIRYGRVRVVRDENGLAEEFSAESAYPSFGNDDDRVDGLAVRVLRHFDASLAGQPIYRDATPTLSVLTITSNVVYGKKTGPTPDGDPPANRSRPGPIPCTAAKRRASWPRCDPWPKYPYDICRDGISYTFSITPRALGADPEGRGRNLAGSIDGYLKPSATIST